jgi:hypothetical protein
MGRESGVDRSWASVAVLLRVIPECHRHLRSNTIERLSHLFAGFVVGRARKGADCVRQRLDRPSQRRQRVAKWFALALAALTHVS